MVKVNSEDLSIEQLDMMDDKIWEVVQLIAKEMGVTKLTNDDFTNEDIMELRNEIMFQISERV